MTAVVAVLVGVVGLVVVGVRRGACRGRPVLVHTSPVVAPRVGLSHLLCGV